jgi:hypothetical protein
MASKRVRPDDEKFKELIVYITRRSEGDEPFGMTKLNKLLFLADFVSYAVRGEAITWQEYQALDQGPAPRRLLPILEQLEDSIVIGEREYYGLKQKRPHALRDPDLSRFTAEEVAFVDALIQEWWGVSASGISEASHRFIGWQVTAKGETIPYEVALVGSREPTKSEIEAGSKLEQTARDHIAKKS